VKFINKVLSAWLAPANKLERGHMQPLAEVQIDHVKSVDMIAQMRA
jgi:hypothetical protein